MKLTEKNDLLGEKLFPIGTLVRWTS